MIAKHLKLPSNLQKLSSLRKFNIQKIKNEKELNEDALFYLTNDILL